MLGNQKSCTVQNTNNIESNPNLFRERPEKDRTPEKKNYSASNLSISQQWSNRIGL